VPRGLIDGAMFESNRNSSSPNLTGGGGALYVSGSLNGGMLEIRDSNFIGNMTSGQGGAMVLGPNARLYDGLMRNNFSGSNGGAVRVSESTLDAPTIIDGAIIETNRAQVRGGGIENSGVLHLSNASIEGNETVTDSGGGISNYDAIWLVVTDTQIIGNSGVFGGGGLFNRHSFLGVRERAPRTTQLTRVEFTDNAVAKSGVDGGYGGGIANDTSLRLRDVSFRRNTAAYAGGAIFATSNYGSSGDRTAFPINLDLVNVTIGANEAETGSGVFQSAGVTHLNNVTIARNSASGTGGGVRVADGVGNATNPNAISSTNSIVALNAAGTAGPDCMGAFRSTGHMLIGNTDSCMLTGGPNDKIGTAGAPIDPLLDPLANYDNRAATFRLLAGSPAIDAGSAATCATLDARGAARNGVCDMGAYEFEGSLKQRQSIVFGALADRPLGSAPVALSATASSGLAVSFASETQAVCALTGAELRLLAVGLCRVVATQPGNSAFEPAPDARQSFTVLAGVVTPPPAGRSLRLMLPVVQR
jgi:predicted outer membrane repeat protein